MYIYIFIYIPERTAGTTYWNILVSPWQEGGGPKISLLQSPRSPDGREKLCVPPWTRSCREGAFYGIFARCSCTLRMQLAVEMLVALAFDKEIGIFFCWKNTGMWMNMKQQIQQQRFLRDPDSRSPKTKTNKSHPCILGDGVAWLVATWRSRCDLVLMVQKLGLAVCPIVYKVLCIPGGVGFLNHQQYEYRVKHLEWISSWWHRAPSVQWFFRKDSRNFLPDLPRCGFFLGATESASREGYL